jgi:hypothetical protein
MQFYTLTSTDEDFFEDSAAPMCPSRSMRNGFDYATIIFFLLQNYSMMESYIGLRQGK